MKLEFSMFFNIKKQQRESHVLCDQKHLAYQFLIIHMVLMILWRLLHFPHLHTVFFLGETVRR